MAKPRKLARRSGTVSARAGGIAPPALCALALITGCMSEPTADACVEADRRAAECGIELSGECDTASAEIVTAASCDELSAFVASSKADGGDCEETCFAQYPDRAACRSLCMRATYRGPATIPTGQQVGAACDPDVDDTTSELFCHPHFDIWTRHCAGFCPGEEFCIEEPHHRFVTPFFRDELGIAIPPNPLGGICVPGYSDFCPGTVLSEEGETTEYNGWVTRRLYETRLRGPLSVPRFVGDTGVPDAMAYTCMAEHRYCPRGSTFPCEHSP